MQWLLFLSGVCVLLISLFSVEPNSTPSSTNPHIYTKKGTLNIFVWAPLPIHACVILKQINRSYFFIPTGKQMTKQNHIYHVAVFSGLEDKRDDTFWHSISHIMDQIHKVGEGPYCDWKAFFYFYFFNLSGWVWLPKTFMKSSQVLFWWQITTTVWLHSTTKDCLLAMFIFIWSFFRFDI